MHHINLHYLLDQERKPTCSSDPLLSIRVSKVEEGLHVVQADVHQICSQLNQVLKLLQNNLTSSIPSNTEPNPKREGKDHTKAITLRSRAVVKEPIRPNCGEKEVSEKDKRTCTLSVGYGVEKEKPDSEPT